MSAKPATTTKPSAIATSGQRLTPAAIALAINKAMGDESIRVLGSSTSSAVPALSTGNLAIDIATGIGGIPRGRIVEIFGPESSGKTTFCLSLAAEAQRRGGIVAFIDVEHALDPKYARVVGVDTDNLLLSQPSSGEEALTIAESLVKTEEVDVIIVDSVAALVPRAELDGQMGDATVGAQARLMSQAMRRLTAIVSKTNSILVFTNQIREKIGVMFGNPETTPGGRALKFFASVRIDIRRKDQIKSSDGKAIGNRTRVRFVKNKVAAPFTECEFDIMFDEGISRSGTLIDLGLEYKILEKRGTWISFNGDLIGQGRDAAKNAVREKADLSTALATAIQAKVDALRAPAAQPEVPEGLVEKVRVDPPGEAPLTDGKGAFAFAGVTPDDSSLPV